MRKVARPRESRGSILLSRRGHEGAGEEKRSLTAGAQPPTSCLRSSPLSPLRSSHLDASLCASSSAGTGTRLPTPVMERKFSTAWLHLASRHGSTSSKNYPRWKSRQKEPWAKVREETVRGKDRFGIPDLLAVSVWAPPELDCGLIPRPFKVLTSEAVTRL